jgi:hypothetical protein
MTTKTTKNKWTVTEKPIWFITGRSTVFSREFAKYLLEICAYKDESCHSYG